MKRITVDIGAGVTKTYSPKRITVTLTEDQVSRIVIGLRMTKFTEPFDSLNKYEQDNNAFTERIIQLFKGKSRLVR